MNCPQTHALISAYADRELDALRGYGVRKHLERCCICVTELRGVLALRLRVGAEVPYYRASHALRARVQEAIRTASGAPPIAPSARARHQRWRWLAGGVVAGCAGSGLAWMMGAAVLAWHASEDIVAAAVAAHVHATLGGGLIEVASSDRHTVKPWLSARLDYSPPVQDLAGDGFPLLGGRVDTIERRPVATLVYRYRQHTIDVFVRPEASSAPALRSVRGFHVVHALGSSMDWLAVSDAEPDALTALVQRLAREDAP